MMPAGPSARRLLAIGLLSAAPFGAARAGSLPVDARSIAHTISYDEMQAFLASVNGKGPITVTNEATTAGGRTVFLVHAARGPRPTFRAFFYAQQHGDEVSGKDALLLLIQEIARAPERLPADVDLWILPMVNPDGAEAGTRHNGAGADLNRDHMVLEQPETQAIHRVVQRVRPHLSVDCHEFARDDEDRQRHGWVAWPDITLDGLNNPLFDAAVIK